MHRLMLNTKGKVPPLHSQWMVSLQRESHPDPGNENYNWDNYKFNTEAWLHCNTETKLKFLPSDAALQKELTGEETRIVHLQCGHTDSEA